MTLLAAGIVASLALARLPDLETVLPAFPWFSMAAGSATNWADNELRVSVVRSCGGSSVGRTRGVGEQGPRMDISPGMVGSADADQVSAAAL